MSFVNQLQEYCQKQKITLPEYTFVSSGSSHAPQWTATISIDEHSITYDTFSSTKSEAKNNVAQKALEKMMQSTQSTYQKPDAISTVYIIDIENQPNISVQPENYYIGVVTSNYGGLSKFESWERRPVSSIMNSSTNTSLVVIQSSGLKDLADHFLTWVAVTVVNSISKGTMYLVSNDHAIYCTCEVLNAYLKESGRDDINVIVKE